MYRYRVREGSLVDFLRWFFLGLPIGALLVMII